jgi:hypothetical protein
MNINVTMMAAKVDDDVDTFSSSLYKVDVPFYFELEPPRALEAWPPL